MRTLRYGGVLHPGDFIAVSYTNCIWFGWYAGDGRGTLQFYSMSGPMHAYGNYESWKKDLADGKIDINSWRSKQYKDGFTTKCLWKSYISSVHKTRVLKITNPEELLTEQEDREIYEKSKEILINLNFIKK